jgi:lipopolysaccharide transport system permease protein
MVLPDIHYRWLILGLLRRRLAERYRGSALGVAWAVLLPLGMLVVYTVFFRHLLGLRWPASSAAGDLDIAVRIFLGLAVVNFAAEIITAAPRLVLEQPAYVKKVQFPLPVLAYVLVAAAGVQLLISLAVAAVVALGLGSLKGGAGLLLMFVFALPLLLWGLAVAWSLAGLGVFLRDLQHLAAPMTTVLLFLSPVFYATSALPAPWQVLVACNPLTVPIEALRAALLGDPWPSAVAWGAQMVAAAVAAVLARLLFERLQPGFADAL